MIVFSFLLYMLLIGMGAGWLAWVILGRSKALTRDRKPNWTLLFGLGIAGSFVGGLAASLLMGEGFALRPSGMIGSVVGSIVVVAIYLAVQKR
jgi:uncharacterized membrane protein YeaQ/YmgE (transglycosylase-associated protein family)